MIWLLAPYWQVKEGSVGQWSREKGQAIWWQAEAGHKLVQEEILYSEGN